MAGICSAACGAMIAEDIRDFQRGARRDAGRLVGRLLRAASARRAGSRELPASAEWFWTELHLSTAQTSILRMSALIRSTITIVAMTIRMMAPVSEY